MQSAASLGEASTIATAQLLGGLSGMLVSEGLARLLREMMGGGAPAGDGSARERGQGQDPEQGQGEPPGQGGADPAGLGTEALKNIVMQGAVGRILALNTVNTYLSLATSEQLRRIGMQLVKGAEEPAAQAQAAPYAQPVWSQPGVWRQPAIGAQPMPVCTWAPPPGAPAQTWRPFPPQAFYGWRQPGL